MTIRTSRPGPGFGAPRAVVFIVLLNVGALAAFEWSSEESRKRRSAQQAAAARPGASCGGTAAKARGNRRLPPLAPVGPMPLLPATRNCNRPDDAR
jgi:hypothetical protein